MKSNVTADCEPGSVEYDIQVLDISIRMANDMATEHKNDSIGQWAIGRIVDLESQKYRLQQSARKKAALAS